MTLTSQIFPLTFNDLVFWQLPFIQSHITGICLDPTTYKTCVLQLNDLMTVIKPGRLIQQLNGPLSLLYLGK